MTKSSKVLRLAAEYVITGSYYNLPIWDAMEHHKIPDDERQFIMQYAFFTGYYYDSDTDEVDSLNLCLAAAIAESDGN